jgi:hypothetical protein
MRSMHLRPSRITLVLCLVLCLALCFGPNPVTASFAPPPVTCTAQATAYAYENIACDHPFAGEDYPSYDCWRVIFASVDGSAHADISNRGAGHLKPAVTGRPLYVDCKN